MAEEFQGGVCGGNWWNSSRNLFGSSPCSSAINDMGSFGWPSCQELIMDMKTVRSSDDSTGSPSDGSSIALQDVQKTQRQTGNGSMSTDHSALQMMGMSLSSSPTSDHWNQDMLHDRGRSEGNYSQILQEAAALNSSMNYRQQTGVDCRELNKDWNSKNFCQDFAINSFKQVNQDFPVEQQPLNSTINSNECDASCQGLSANFPLNSASYSYTSSLLQTLFDTDSQPQQSLLDNLQDMNYSSATSYRMNSNEFLPKASPNMVIKTSIAKQQAAAANHLQFTNNTPFWNAPAAALSNARPNFIPSASTHSQFLPSSLNSTKNIGAKHHNEDGRDLASTGKKSSCNEPSFKRPRIETPSPLPTFKVRKEKLGDRITALQQLVSPFGKTDTASVLHEAIEYIKFLHDQVNVLSTPYLKNGSPQVMQRQQAGDNLKDQESLKQDLSSRGLCLVPISSTFPVTAETTSDFWTPTFGGSFR